MMNILKKGSVLAVVIILIAQLARAQHIYTGKVFDAATRQPIAYASINAGNKATITNETGSFRILLAQDTATLTITCIGYDIQNIKVVANGSALIVLMKKGNFDLKEICIMPEANNASFHTLSCLDLSLRPVNSSQDLMRLVPGLFIAQHMGGGKAEQMLIRGFDADHGTDMNISVDEMPVNMVSHIHAQGYADLHFLIPETVASYDFGKGPYYIDKGDFATAGYLNYNTKDAPDRNLLSVEAGQFNTFRVAALISLLSDKVKQKGTNAYLAGEYNYTDGPFDFAEHYKRFNLFGKYTTLLNAANKLSFSASAFSTGWRASGEIPERAVAANTTAIDANGNAVILPAATPVIGRFATIDSTQGGNSTRYNAIAKLNTDLKNNLNMQNQVYYTHYTFGLHVNSTFFADNNTDGDLRQQHESRDMFGYNSTLSKVNYWGNSSTLTSVLGLSTRFDHTYGTNYTHVTPTDMLLDVVTRGDIRQNNSALYMDETLQNGKWLLNAGARIDHFNFGYHDSTQNKTVISPKINIQYTANQQMQLYIKAGKGFHSNNAIAVIDNNGLQILPAAYGTDLGLNWKPAQHLYINAALWYMYLEQEFVYTDDGTIAPGGKTKRAGIDVSARYQLAKWLYADANINLARARFADSTANTGYLPLAPTFSSTGGFDFKFNNGINGGISYRYLHNRPGNNTNTLTADGYFVTDLKMNYTQHKYELGLSIENLLNTQWNEYEVETLSQLRNEPAPVDQMSFTAGTPFFAKLHIALFF